MPARLVDEPAAFPPGQYESLRRMARAGNYNAWLLERSTPHLGGRVLDVGAGTGTFTERIAQGREHVVALEPDPALFPILQRRLSGRPNIVLLDAESSELAKRLGDEHFDSIVCFNVLEHIADDAEALRDFHAQLTPGGRLLLLVPAHASLFGSLDETVGHERRYDKRSLRNVLDVAGFAISELRYVNPVGALGWFVSSRLLRREHVPEGPLRIFDRFVPLLRALDRIDIGFGLSLWAVSKRR
jgi:SAM-dependent methyltransferase